MMTDFNMVSETSFAFALIFITATIAFALLKGWNGWLAFKRLELEHAAPTRLAETGGDENGVTARIEMAHLRERIRKLEAIAAGIDV